MVSSKRKVSCRTTPIWSRTFCRSRSRRSCPSNAIVPLDGRCIPSRRRASVDLPAPDGPTMATFSPARMRTETFFSVGGSVGENPKLTS